MTDQELQERLRRWYAAEVGNDKAAPASLYNSVTALSVSVRLQPGSTRAALPPPPLGGGRTPGWVDCRIGGHWIWPGEAAGDPASSNGLAIGPTTGLRDRR